MVNIIRAGSTCERCGNISSKELQVTHYTENDNDLLLCDECLQKITKEYDEIIENERKARAIKCHNCKGFVWKLEGLRNYRGKQYCVKCQKEAEDKFENRKKIKDFFKSNWKFWIVLGFMITTILVARELI